MNALILAISAKKFASRPAKERRVFWAGEDGLSVVSICGDKGITYKRINHAAYTKTYCCCPKNELSMNKAEFIKDKILNQRNDECFLGVYNKESAF